MNAPRRLRVHAVTEKNKMARVEALMSPKGKINPLVTLTFHTALKTAPKVGQILTCNISWEET